MPPSSHIVAPVTRPLSCRQPGGAASRYEQFLAYLAAKDPAGRIQVATLPFEGRNKVLFRLP